MTALSLQRLTVRYGSVIACEEVSLSVARGEVYALLGRKGAGKSSLVRCAVGLQRPSSGRAELFGEDVWKRRARLIGRVGLVPEEPDARPAMTPRQIADFWRRRPGTRKLKGVEELLTRFSVPHGVPFGRLSTRQKGAALLALALENAPELLILDDPTSSLDQVPRRVLYEEIVEELTSQGTAVFLATHDPAGVGRIATRVGILKHGRLVLDEKMETLKSRFRRIRYGNRMTETRTVYGTELDIFDAVRVKVRGWGVDAIVSNYDDQSFERFRATDGVVDAEVSEISLEEIVLAVAGEDRGEGP